MVDPQAATDARVRRATARWFVSGVVALSVCATTVAGVDGGAVARASATQAHVAPARVEHAGGSAAGHRSPQVSTVSPTTTAPPGQPSTVSAPPATTASTSVVTPAPQNPPA